MQRFVSLIITSLVLLSVNLAAQDNSDEKLALQYFQNAEYNKSVVLFEKLFEKNPQSGFYYEYYLNCMLNTDQLDKATSLLKKLKKKNPGNPAYAVDYGYVMKLSNESKKAEKIYQKIEDNLAKSKTRILQVANAFYRRSEFDHAIKVYQKGRKILDDPAAFNNSLARLYQLTHETGKMMDEYFTMLNIRPAMLESVQNMLQDYIIDETEYETVKEKLVSQVQKSNFAPVFVNLLSWVYIQKKDFESAFRQQKALDKRMKNNSQALLQLADVCILNKSFTVASDIYEYILEKGMSNPYYYRAKFGLIDIRYQQIKAEKEPSKEELLKIEKEYSEFLRLNFYSFIGLAEKVILRLAEVKAIYLGKTSEAIAMLTKYLEIPQISKETKARMKLDLADYYVLEGDVWEATLLYQQVVKDYTGHPIGHEAKFRNSKLAFYMGNFEWAADQLDILKASTSELIANDALQLALLIQDNLGMDTTDIPLKMYARADFFYFKHQNDSALSVCDSVADQFPNHTIADDILLLKGKIYESKKEYLKAIEAYNQLITSQQDVILMDDAVYRSAIIYENYLENPGKAFEYFEKIILEYPGSVFAVEARKRYRLLKESLEPQATPDS